MSQDRHLGSSNKRVGHPLPENQKMASRALRRPGASRFADRRGRLLSAARASPSHSPDPQAFSIGQDREGRTQGPLGADQHNPGVGGAGSEQVAVASGGDSFPPTPVTRTAPGVQGTCWSPPRSALHSKGLAWPHGQRRPEVGPPHPGKARLRRTQAAACAQGTVQVKEHVLSWWERGPKSVKTHPSVLSQTPARWPCMGARSREGSLPPLRPAPPGLASAWQWGRQQRLPACSAWDDWALVPTEDSPGPALHAGGSGTVQPTVTAGKCRCLECDLWWEGEQYGDPARQGDELRHLRAGRAWCEEQVTERPPPCICRH